MLGGHLLITAAHIPTTSATQSKNMWILSDSRPKDPVTTPTKVWNIIKVRFRLCMPLATQHRGGFNASLPHEVEDSPGIFLGKYANEKRSARPVRNTLNQKSRQL